MKKILYLILTVVLMLTYSTFVLAEDPAEIRQDGIVYKELSTGGAPTGVLEVTGFYNTPDKTIKFATEVNGMRVVTFNSNVNVSELTDSSIMIMVDSIPEYLSGQLGMAFSSGKTIAELRFVHDENITIDTATSHSIAGISSWFKQIVVNEGCTFNAMSFVGNDDSSLNVILQDNISAKSINVKNNGNVFVGKNLNCESGSIVATGNISIKNNCKLPGNIESKGNVTIQNDCTGGVNLVAKENIFIGSNCDLPGNIQSHNGAATIKNNCTASLGSNLQARGDIIIEENCTPPSNIESLEGSIIIKSNCIALNHSNMNAIKEIIFGDNCELPGTITTNKITIGNNNSTKQAQTIFACSSIKIGNKNNVNNCVISGTTGSVLACSIGNDCELGNFQIYSDTDEIDDLKLGDNIVASDKLFGTENVLIHNLIYNRNMPTFMENSLKNVTIEKTTLANSKYTPGTTSSIEKNAFGNIANIIITESVNNIGLGAHCDINNDKKCDSCGKLITDCADFLKEQPFAMSPKTKIDVICTNEYAKPLLKNMVAQLGEIDKVTQPENDSAVSAKYEYNPLHTANNYKEVNEIIHECDCSTCKQELFTAAHKDADHDHYCDDCGYMFPYKKLPQDPVAPVEVDVSGKIKVEKPAIPETGAQLIVYFLYSVFSII